ncbi:uncharacterized protein EAE98_012019 [Botrytis deweyae]|uniref:Heterokaryon incompatibility domain-containing protein n=1 Tax=Botrytis deweyae TaxID=2478750 RepID=A0ABQ7I4F0_9HELO|nr:uncharacterized protein EAE98_012019 [Botrytis deweyae]KAF7910487.1 hypothetical protein EAE98_012019 [Botrytis deweyae]
MLCTTCQNISFAPLQQTGVTFQKEATEEIRAAYSSHRFFFHDKRRLLEWDDFRPECQLCKLMTARLRCNVNRSSGDELSAALDLTVLDGKDYLLWNSIFKRTRVILTQKGEFSKSSDGRNFVKINDGTNWSGSFNIHFGDLSVEMDLNTLFGELPRVFSKSAFLSFPAQRFEDGADGFDASLKLASTWMIDCFNHKLCRETIGTLPTRVIYIDENPSIAPRLVEPKGQIVPYATLSYCWGKKGQLQLKKANHLQFLNALPVQMLSKTTQDAIRVTRALSIKYLWVDALCIIQDSAEDKSRELAVMGDIYSRSVITIGAANGDHADAGLFAKRDPHQQRPSLVYEIEADGSNTQIFAQLPRDDEQGTILDSRGWIFQEEVLSARTLKFCPDGLRWSCVTLCATETTPNGNSHPSNRLDYRLKTWLHCPEWKTRCLNTSDPKRRYFQDWYEAVSCFTVRNLTYNTDKLPALAGIATQMHNIHKYDYLAGLWKQDLDYGLLWYVASQPKIGSGKYEFPSLLGEEYYTVVPKKGRNIPKAASSVAEGMSQLSTGNIETHTPFLRNVPISSSGTAQRLKAALPNLEKRDEFKAKSPSWSWASLEHEKINFLYSHSGLKPSGGPLSHCLEVDCSPSDKGNVFTQILPGHMILTGHLKRAQVHFDDYGYDTQYLAPNVSAGRWPGTLVQLKANASGEGEVIGFVALDSNPVASGLRVHSLAILLMREDDKDSSNVSMAKNGKLGYYSSSKVPLTLARLRNGNISMNRGTKRYLTGLALQQVLDVNNLAIFRRVGLCQLYREFWTDELKKDLSKQKMNLMVV